MKAINDTDPDRDILTLRIYREIATRIVEYTRYFMEDGIAETEILSMLDKIEKDMERMEQGATSATQHEIEEIRWIIGGAYKMVRSTYKNKAGGRYECKSEY